MMLLLLLGVPACHLGPATEEAAEPVSDQFFDFIDHFDPVRAKLGRRTDFGWEGCSALDSGFVMDGGPGALVREQGVLRFDCPWGTGPFTLELAMRGNPPCQVTVSLNGRELGRPQLKRGPTSHSWEVDGEILQDRDNLLVIEAPDGSQVRLNRLVLPPGELSAVEGKRRVPVLPAMPPTRISYTVSPSRGDRLSFETFYRRSPARPPKGMIHFEVMSVFPSHKDLLFSRTVRVGPKRPDVQMEPGEVDLTPLAGREVELMFITRFEGETHWPMAGEAAWARPRILPARGSDRTPLIIWLVDTMRADHVGCYGYERDTSPNFDTLAEEGLRFEHLTAQSSWTRPSIATILTGLHPSAHGAVGREDGMLPGVTTLAQVLKGQGYTTATFSANGNFYAENLGLSRGFDEVWGYWVPGRETDPAVMTKELVRDLFKWIDRHAGEPVFLFVHTVDPHDPYSPPAPYDTMFVDGDGPSHESVDVPQLREWGKEAGPDFNRQRQQAVDLYDGEIAYNDALFGRFVEKLKKSGLYDNALLLVVSDHGEEFGDHQEWGHGRTLFGEQIDLPLIVRLPGGRAAGTVVNHRVRQVDLMPSLLDWLGLPLPVTQGVSFAEAVEAGEQPLTGEVLAEEALDGNELYSLIDGRYKYILRVEPWQGEALYDLEADPGELHNIIGDHPDVARPMAERVAAFHREAADALQARRSRQPVRLSDQEIANLRALGYLQ